MGGLGVIPIAIIMTLLRRDWSGFGNLAVTGISVLVLRFLGAWIVDRTEQRKFETGAAKVSLSAIVLGVLTLIFGLLTVFFGLRAVLDEAPPDQDLILFIIIRFFSAAICGVVAAVCGYLTCRRIKSRNARIVSASL
jgi:cytochrome bd-type quinol oxidase subunit 2